MIKIGSIIRIIKMPEEYLHLPTRWKDWSFDCKVDYFVNKRVSENCIGREYKVTELEEDLMAWIFVNENGDEVDDDNRHGKNIHHIGWFTHEYELVEE